MSQAVGTVGPLAPIRSPGVIRSARGDVLRVRRGAHGSSSMRAMSECAPDCFHRKARSRTRKQLSGSLGRTFGQVDSESRAVNIAIGSNVFIFAAKVWVSSTSGSSALFAEAVHTLADIGNQLLLRFGIARSNKAPTKDHPYGYMKEKFIFSLISAVGVFCIGAGASVINGAYALADTDHDVDNFGLNFVVLAVSFVVEGFSCVVAVRALADGAERRGVTFAEYLDSGSDPAAVAVMAEDGAAVIGVTIAAISNWLVKATDWQAWDGIGSILVGVLLSFVALFLIQRNRAVLIGRSMAADELAVVLAYLHQDPVVNHVYDARSEEIGPGVYRFSAELDFSGEKIAERHLKTVDAEQLAHKFFHTQNPANYGDTRAFSIALREYGAQLVRAVGTEVDRIEGDIQNLVPGVRYVDLEADRGRFWLYRASVDGDEDIRQRFDISQLSLDAVTWESEATKIDYLLSVGPNGTVKAADGGEGGGVGASGGRSTATRSAADLDRIAARLMAPAEPAAAGTGSSGGSASSDGGPRASGVEAANKDAARAGEASVIAWDVADSNSAEEGGSLGGAGADAAFAAAAAADSDLAGKDGMAVRVKQGSLGQMRVRVGAASSTGQVMDVELDADDRRADNPAGTDPTAGLVAGVPEGPGGARGERARSGADTTVAAGAAAPVEEEMAVGAKGSKRQ